MFLNNKYFFCVFFDISMGDKHLSHFYLYQLRIFLLLIPTNVQLYKFKLSSPSSHQACTTLIIVIKVNLDKMINIFLRDLRVKYVYLWRKKIK
jgi:hypothetical protein